MVDDVQGLEGAIGLRSLVLTFNELTSMEGLTPLTRLTSLDLSFNAISRIQALKVTPPPPPPPYLSKWWHARCICFLSSHAFSPCNPIRELCTCFLMSSCEADYLVCKQMQIGMCPDQQPSCC